LVTGISEGAVTVTVTTDDGGLTDAVVINVISPSSQFNWALSKPIVGTGTPDGANVPEQLVDDNTDTRWSVQDFPKSATVDLGQIIRINATEVTCYQDRAYQFNLVDNHEARYVRITVTGADVYTGPWVSLTELRVFGVEGGVTSVTNEFQKKVQLNPNPATSISIPECVDMCTDSL